MNLDLPDKAIADAVRNALIGDHRHDAPLAGATRETVRCSPAGVEFDRVLIPRR